MKKVLYISFFMIALMLAGSQNSYACSCMVTDAPVKELVTKAFNNSTAVFEGKVLSVKPSKVDEHYLVVTIASTKMWKGKAGKEIKITTANHSAACGYSFEVGNRYLIYANQSANGLSASNCSRTAVFVKNGDIKYLKKLKKEAK